MSIVQLKSENKDFSWIISKNPDTGILGKSVRQGYLFGFYSKENTAFNVYFKDGVDEISFKKYEDQEFEYNNANRFTSAVFIPVAIRDMFRSAFNSNEYMDLDGVKVDNGGYKSEFFINLIYIKNDRHLNAFSRHFKDYEISIEKIIDQNYRIKISTTKSIHELLNFASLFGMFMAMVNEEPFYVVDDDVVKNIKCMNVVNAPYFIRYLFKIKFIKSKKMFSSDIKDFGVISEKLGGLRGGCDIEMVYGTNYQSRQIEIEKRLDFNRNIIDIGCGEGKYAVRFNQYLRGNKYFAIDVDEKVLFEAKMRIKNKNLKNISFFSSLDNYKEIHEGSVDIICTEVIEHMPTADAFNFVCELMDLDDVNSLIITTPNSDFNKHYFEDEGSFRHHDHDWEPTSKEFLEFITNATTGLDCDFEFFGMGDIVDGVAPTQGVKITFK